MKSLFLSVANIKGTQLRLANEIPMTLDNISLVLGYDYEATCYFLKVENLYENIEKYASIEETDFKKIQTILIKRVPLAYECEEQGYPKYGILVRYEKENKIFISFIENQEQTDKMKLEL